MEERKPPPFGVQLPISFSGDGVAGGGLVTSLSTAGCTVVSAESVQTGTYLRLRIQLPEEDLPIEVDLAAVRWAHGGKLGLEFIRIRPEEQERLDRLF